MTTKRTEILTSTGDLQIDAVLQIKDSYKNTLSKYRIEGGSEITENAYTENLKISLSGIISDAIVPTDKKDLPSISVKQDTFPAFTPGFITSAISKFKKGERPTVKIQVVKPSNVNIDVYEAAKRFLKEIRRSRELISIRTQKELYEGLLITSLEFSRDKSTGRSISFKMSLEQPEFAVSKETESTRKSKTNLQQTVPKADKGWRATDPVDEESAAGQSALLKIFGARPGEGIIDSLTSFLN